METDEHTLLMFGPESSSVPSVNEEVPVQICVVCGDVSDGPHFGAVSCRACAAFFRRTVSLKLEYVCRASSSCQIDKLARNMCRFCRYQKCLRQGMLITAVQIPRDGIGKHQTTAKLKRDKNPVRKSSDVYSNSSNSASISQLSVTSLEQNFGTDDSSHVVNPLSTMLNDVVQRPSEDNELEYLCKMSEGYHHFLAIRRATQNLNGDGTSVFKAFCSTGEPQVTNYDEAKKFCKMESHILTDIINNYFPPFNELPVDDKITAFKNFYSYFAYATRAFATYETFGKGPEYDDRVLMHEGGYIKLSELEKFYENCVKCTAAPKDAARIFLPAQRYLLDVVVAHMRRIKIVEAEFLTLIGMLLWNDSLPFSRPEISSMVWKAREAIIANLYKFHQSQGIVGLEAFSRITNIMLLLPKVQKLTLDMNLNFKMAEIFNFFAADECCKDFILQ